MPWKCFRSVWIGTGKEYSDRKASTNEFGMGQFVLGQGGGIWVGTVTGERDSMGGGNNDGVDRGATGVTGVTLVVCTR